MQDNRKKRLVVDYLDVWSRDDPKSRQAKRERRTRIVLGKVLFDKGRYNLNALEVGNQLSIFRKDSNSLECFVIKAIDMTDASRNYVVTLG